MQLGESKTECAKDVHGLLKLDDDGKMVICDASKKGAEKFKSAGGAASFVGLNADAPAGDCGKIQASLPFKFETGRFWIIAADKETPIEVVCEMEVNPAVSLGGDGSSKLKAAYNCKTLRDFFGKTAENNGKFWIVDNGEEACDFDQVRDAKVEKDGKWNGQYTQTPLTSLAFIQVDVGDPESLSNGPSKRSPVPMQNGDRGTSPAVVQSPLPGCSVPPTVYADMRS